MMNPSTLPSLTDDEMLMLVPSDTGPGIFALDQQRWLAYRAVLELTAARARVELARRTLVEVKAALKGISAADRLVAAARIDEALLAL
jgi:hypothetical protein